MDPERRIAIALPLLPLREPPDSCSRAPGRPANIITPVRNKKTSDSAYRQKKNKRRLKKLLRGPRTGHLRDSRFYKKKKMLEMPQRWRCTHLSWKANMNVKKWRQVAKYGALYTPF